jgi:membrane associated rhomboid family serine protease
VGVDPAAEASDDTRAEAPAATPRPAGRFFDGAPVTRGLFWANVAVFACELLIAYRQGSPLTIPLDLMATLGGNVIDFPIEALRPERWITSAFLHWSVLHVAFNLSVLGTAGPTLERSVGAGRYALMYLAATVTGAIGSIVEAWFKGHRVSAGASGAVCGVIAAGMVVQGRIHSLRSQHAHALAGWSVVIVFLGISMRQITDNGAHIGGAIAGAAIAFAWRRGVNYGDVARRACIGALVIGVIGAAAIVLVREARDPCAAATTEVCYQRAVTALSSRQCGKARAVTRSPHFFGDERFDALRGSIARQCAD